VTGIDRSEVKRNLLCMNSVINDYKKYVDNCSQEELAQFVDRLSDVWAKMPMGISDKHTFETYMLNAL
jgi:hypothetical protein